MKSSGGAKTNNNSGNSNESTVTGALCKMAGGISSFSEKIERIHGKMPERIAIAIYVIGHFLMMLVHEPWFDEALAWLIARDSSLYEILFVAPHYEGHPALWHLVLAPFAKLGVSYELSLGVISLLFSGTAIILFIYKAPFKRVIRLTIPFTFYIFYQYSVISRPYSMMMLAFVLLAITYKNRNEKPGRYILALFFLCMTSAYGVVIAGGICIAWLIELFKKAYDRSKNKNSENGESRGTIKIFFADYLLKKGLLFMFLALLCYALFIIWRIIPEENAYALVRQNDIVNNGLFIRLIYTMFAVFSDVFITNVYALSEPLQRVALPRIELIFATIIGILILGLIISFVKKKKCLLQFIIPYLLLAFFSSIVYYYDHHIGIYLLFIGYVMWTSVENVESVALSSEKNESKNNFTSSLVVLGLSIMIIIPLYWSVTTCICDAIYEYGFGRNEYRFLEENGLENSSILAEWYVISNEIDEKKDISRDQTGLSIEGFSIAPYLTSDNLVNSPKTIDRNYTYAHSLTTVKEQNDFKEKLITSPFPEVLLGMPDIESLYGSNNLNIGDYTRVYEVRFSTIKKGIPGSDVSYIYVRNNIAKEKGLSSVSE